jgi:hypothetical protein
MKFKRRHGEYKQGCVLSQSYPATDTPAPILSACVFVIRDTVRHPRWFLLGKIVREQGRS